MARETFSVGTDADALKFLRGRLVPSDRVKPAKKVAPPKLIEREPTDLARPEPEIVPEEPQLTEFDLDQEALSFLRSGAPPPLTGGLAKFKRTIRRIPKNIDRELDVIKPLIEKTFEVGKVVGQLAAAPFISAPLLPIAALARLNLAAAKAGIEATSKLARFISDFPVPAPDPLNKFPLPPGVKSPETLGELAAVAFQPLPQMERMVEAAANLIPIDPKDLPFGSGPVIDRFLRLTSVLGIEERGKVSRFVLRAVIPTSAGGIAIDLTLFGTPILLRVLGGGLIRGNSAKALREIIKNPTGPVRREVVAANIREMRILAQQRADEIQDLVNANIDQLTFEFAERFAKVVKRAPRLTITRIIEGRLKNIPIMVSSKINKGLRKAARIQRSLANELGIVSPITVKRAAQEIGRLERRTRKQASLIKPKPGETNAEFAARLAKRDLQPVEEVGFFARAMRETRGVLQRMGPNGATLAKLWDQWEDQSVSFAAEIMVKVRPVIARLNAEEKLTVAKLLDPTRRRTIKKKLSPKVREARNEIVEATKPLFEMLQNDPRMLGEDARLAFKANDLFAHYFDTSNSKVNSTLLELLKGSDEVKLGLAEFKAKVPNASAREIEEFLETSAQNTLKYYLKSIVNERRIMSENTWDMAKMVGTRRLPFADDLEFSLDRTIQAWSRRAKETEILGLQKEGWHSNTLPLRNSLVSRGRDADFLDKANQAVTRGTLPSLAQPGIDAALAYNVYTKMGLSAVRNSAQFFVNTTSKTSFASARRAQRVYMTEVGEKKYREFFDEVVLQGMRRDISDATGVKMDDLRGDGVFTNKITPTNFLRLVCFIRVEKFNRVASGLAGSFETRGLAKTLKQSPAGSTAKAMAERRLREFKMSEKDIQMMLRTGRATSDQQKRAGLEVIRSSQFKTGPLDLPLWWQSPEGKLLTQFQSFTFRQAIFMKGLIDRGDPGAIGTFIALNGTMGIATQSTIDFLRGKPVEDIAAVRTIERTILGKRRPTATDNIFIDAMRYQVSSVGIGIWAELMSDLFPELVGRRRTRRIGQVGGPSLGNFADAIEIASGLAETSITGEADPSKESARIALNHLPLVGRTVARTALPRKPRRKFEREDEPAFITLPRKALKVFKQDVTRFIQEDADRRRKADEARFQKEQRESFRQAVGLRAGIGPQP